MTDFEKNCEILERVASNYSQDSEEYKAIKQATQALHFVQRKEEQPNFERFLEDFDRELTDAESEEYDSVKDVAISLHFAWKEELRAKFRKVVQESGREFSEEEMKRLQDMGIL